MGSQDVRQECLELMKTTPVAIVTTIDPEGFPQTRAMFNLHNRVQFPSLENFFNAVDDFSVYLTTNTSSAKVAHIRTNPKTSIYFCNPSEFQGLMLSGEMSVETDKAIKEALWQEGWTMYYPGGVHDPDHTVLCLRPAIVRYYRRLSTFTFQPGKKQ